MKSLSILLVALAAVFTPLNAGDVTFNLSPNPANNNVNITFTDKAAGNTRIEVYSVLGNLLFTRDLNSSMYRSFNLDCSALTEGMYLVKVSSSNSVTVKRLKVQH